MVNFRRQREVVKRLPDRVQIGFKEDWYLYRHNQHECTILCKRYWNWREENYWESVKIETLLGHY